MGKNKKKVRGKKPKKLKLFTSEDLLKMTDNFSKKNLIGTFQFGKLYHGFLEEKHFTVKIWNPPSLEHPSLDHHECRLMDELILFLHQRLVHPCLPSLYGYCRDNEDHLAVVYNLKAKNSLLKLFLKGNFTWAQRIKVALALACLLKFLQDRFGDLDPFVIRNLSPAHVILDEKYNPKLVDFGMITGGIFPNRQVYAIQASYGSFGYSDHDLFKGWMNCAIWTKKSDVFAFGVMLLSLLSKKVMKDEKTDEPFFVHEWADTEYEKGCISLVHESLQVHPGFYAIDGLELSKLGVQCTSSRRINRPTFNKVVESFSALRIFKDHRELLGVENLFCLNEKLYFTASLGTGNSKKPLRDTKIDSSSFVTKEFLKCDACDLRRYTNNFSVENYIGRFQFGKLFRGVYQNFFDGVHYMVVKIWDNCQTLEDNLLKLGDEMMLFHHERYICHPGLSRMYGYCTEDEHVAIVLYFSPMNSVCNLLASDDFSWLHRTKAACGVASLLKFLHDVSHRMDPFIIRNLDVAHVLLDKNYNPRLFDFGLITGGIYPNRSMVPVKANLEWHDDQVEPTYDKSGTWTSKSDVFSFGVLLFCLISKRSNVAKWVYDYEWLATSNEIETDLVHESLHGDSTYDKDDGQAITRLILQCVQINSASRPTMSEVFEALEKLQVVQKHSDDVMYAENIFRKKCAMKYKIPFLNMPGNNYMAKLTF